MGGGVQVNHKWERVCVHTNEGGMHVSKRGGQG